MALITQAEFERRVGPRSVATYLDDDGDGVADADRVTEVLEEASAIVVGILLGSFSTAQVTNLAANDYALRGAVSDVAADLMARRRPELLSADGTTPYTSWRKSAEAVLERIARAERRAGAEATQGTNKNLRGRVNIDPPQFTFAASKGNSQGPGGY